MTDQLAKKYFFLFALLHFLLWTIIPTLVSPHAPLDVIEGYAWGQEWLIGTHKHPPMQAWLLHIGAQITGHAGFTHFLLSQIAIIITFWAVWDIGRRIASPAIALASVLLLETIAYYNFLSTEFNPNILQIMFWALIARSYYLAIKTEKTSHWFWLGLWAACGIYSKYFTVFFLLSLACLTLANPQARQYIFKRGPYLALIICAALLTPHIFWLVQHEFIPLTYTQSRLVDDTQNAFTFILQPLNFTLSQIFLLLPMILFALLLCGFRRHKSPPQDRLDKDFLIYTTFGTLVITCLLSMLFGWKLKTMWGASFWNFAPLWLLAIYFKETDIQFRKRFVIPWLILVLALPIIYGTVTFAQPYQKGKIKRVHFAGKELAQIVEQKWQEQYHTPLSFVIGDTWVAGAVSHYATSRPSLFLENNPVISPWTNIDKVKTKGGIFLALPCLRPCDNNIYAAKKQDFIEQVTTSYPQAIIQNDLSLHPATGSDKPAPIVIHWAIIPPTKDTK